MTGKENLSLTGSTSTSSVSFYKHPFNTGTNSRTVTKDSKFKNWNLSSPLSGMNDDGTGCKICGVGEFEAHDEKDGFVCFSEKGTGLDIAFPMHVACYSILGEEFIEYASPCALSYPSPLNLHYLIPLIFAQLTHKRTED